MITCNGSPKTGTHLLLKAVYMFGGLGFTAVHRHSTAAIEVVGKHIHIKRNPRNVLISYIRHFDESNLSKENIIKHIPIVIEEMKEYIPWLNDKNVLNVSFEELLTNKNELIRISEYLEMPLIDDHFKKIWGNTKTFSGSLSNWRDHWSEDIEKAWFKNDGDLLERLFGYNPDVDEPKVRPVS